MFQNIIVQQVERYQRLRLLYAIHLGLYGLLLASIGIVTGIQPGMWQLMLLVALAWLPFVLLHTAAQSVLELRQRCAAYAPVPVSAFSRAVLPVDLYDEDGNLITGERKSKIDLLTG